MDIDKKLPEEQPATVMQIKDLRSLVYRLRWPASKVAPQVAYDVARATQEIDKATVGTLRQVNKIVERLRDMDDKGDATVYFRPIDLGSSVVVTPL